jgi:hypothetical protein
MVIIAMVVMLRMLLLLIVVMMMVNAVMRSTPRKLKQRFHVTVIAVEYRPFQRCARPTGGFAV